MTTEPVAYTLANAIAASGIGRTRLYELLAAGTIEARKAGTRTLILGDSLRSYLASLPRADIRVKPSKRAA